MGLYDKLESTWPSPGFDAETEAQLRVTPGQDIKPPAHIDVKESVMTIHAATQEVVEFGDLFPPQRNFEENLNFGANCLNAVIKGIWERSIPPENCVIPPSILLLPVPTWNENSEMLNILLYAIDSVGDEAPVRRRNLEALATLPHFPFAHHDQAFVEDGPSLSHKANLVNALVVYLEEMTGIHAGADEELLVDFTAAASMLDQIPFSSPWPTHPETFNHCGRSIIIGDIKLPAFQARLRRYFEQKGQERTGHVPYGSSIRDLRVSTMPVSGTFSRVSPSKVIVPSSRAKFRDWRKRNRRNMG